MLHFRHWIKRGKHDGSNSSGVLCSWMGYFPSDRFDFRSLKMIPFRENYHRTQPGNYHAWGLVLYITDDFGDAVRVPRKVRWHHPEFED